MLNHGPLIGTAIAQCCVNLNLVSEWVCSLSYIWTSLEVCICRYSVSCICPSLEVCICRYSVSRICTFRELCICRCTIIKSIPVGASLLQIIHWVPTCIFENKQSIEFAINSDPYANKMKFFIPLEGCCTAKYYIWQLVSNLNSMGGRCFFINTNWLRDSQRRWI